MKKNKRWNSAPPKMQSSFDGVWGYASTSRKHRNPRKRIPFVFESLYIQRHCLLKKEKML